MGLSTSFDRAYRRLSTAFGRYQDAPREPERLDELVDARVGLEDARRDVRSEGERYRASPENPNFVEPGLGTDSNSVAGKVAAMVFAIGAVVAIIWGAMSIRAGIQPDLEFESVGRSSLEVSDGGRCVWRLDGEFRNVTSRDLDVEQAWVRTDAGVSKRLFDPFVVPAGSVAPFNMAFLLVEEGCPTSITDISLGEIRINDDFTVKPLSDG